MTKELIVFLKTKLLVIVTLLVLCIGMLFVCNYMIATADESSSNISPEQYKLLISSFSAVVGLLFVFAFVGREEDKCGALLRTWPLSEKDIAVACYPAALAQHFAGVLSAILYFTVGYFINLFQNPLKDYLEIGVVLFFLGWLCEILLIPLFLSKVKSWQITCIVSVIFLIPMCAFVMIIRSDTERLFKIIDWFKDNALLLMICSAVVACGFTPFSMRIAASCVRKERII